jgi:hypothetical protein
MVLMIPVIVSGNALLCYRLYFKYTIILPNDKLSGPERLLGLSPEGLTKKVNPSGEV